jgi:3'-phosphoadenosine 5'-phosphosulfate (PAPS) 3'-phosphatase
MPVEWRPEDGGWSAPLLVGDGVSAAPSRRANSSSSRGPKVSARPASRCAGMTLTQFRMEALHQFWASVGAAQLVPTPAFTPKCAAVLAGECDAALYLPVRPHRTAIWDYSAAALLLAEAGGVVRVHGRRGSPAAAAVRLYGRVGGCTRDAAQAAP